jgi:hydroxymethylpyrimidine pyrophosphatase-like HAD family hydrolase
MRFQALACDYDGTVADEGRVAEATLTALERVRASGRKLILVTGRELDELLSTFSDIHLFERVVAENGALSYRPDNQETKVLGNAPPEELIETLRRRNVRPLSVGHVIIGTARSHETVVQETIRELRLDLQIILNRDSLMVLPSHINKGTGLAAALRDLDLSPHNVVGVGDAENDHSLLALCELGVAVGNALPTLKQSADMVTEHDNGAGVIEVVDKLLGGELFEKHVNE